MEVPARTPVPADLAAPAPLGITEPQLRFVTALINERDTSGRGATDAQLIEQAKTLSKRDASRWIERLQALPKLPSATTAGESSRFGGRVEVAYSEIELDSGRKRVGRIVVPGDQYLDVPRGRYALDVTGDSRFANDTIFLRVWVGERGGWNVKLQNSDDDLVKPAFSTQLDLIRLIAANPAEASARYGHEFAHCGVCGRGLTNDESRAKGIGPVCSSRLGW